MKPWRALEKHKIRVGATGDPVREVTARGANVYW